MTCWQLHQAPAPGRTVGVRWGRCAFKVTVPRTTPQNFRPAASKPRQGGKGTDSEDDVLLPRRGLFALADTKAEVYSRAGEKFDPAKKGGRYKPEFIWNTDWQTALAREESLQRKVDEARARPKTADSGFLSLSRVSELDRMDVDLSEMLSRKRREDAEAAEAAAAAAAAAARQAQRASTSGAGSTPRAPLKAIPAFSRKEVIKLDRLSKSMARAAAMVELPPLEAEKALQAEAERLRYEQLAVEQQIWTLVFSGAGFVMTYVSYTQDVAVSYVVGAMAGFAYLRLLTKSVDAVGGAGLASGVASQPRLLIPIIMGLGYNRFNYLYSEQLGVHLELLPMLVGFFTYKLAVISRQFKDVFDGMT